MTDGTHSRDEAMFRALTATCTHHNITSPLPLSARPSHATARSPSGGKDFASATISLHTLLVMTGTYKKGNKQHYTPGNTVNKIKSLSRQNKEGKNGEGEINNLVLKFETGM